MLTTMCTAMYFCCHYCRLLSIINRIGLHISWQAWVTMTARLVPYAKACPMEPWNFFLKGWNFLASMSTTMTILNPILNPSLLVNDLESLTRLEVPESRTRLKRLSVKDLLMLDLITYKLIVFEYSNILIWQPLKVCPYLVHLQNQV